MTRNTVGALILLLFSHLLFGEAWKLPNLQRRALAAALSIPLLSTSIMPTISRATPLGDHTICAYPACTSQKDILLNSAPSLASKADKADLYNNLASIEKFLSAYPQLLETNDYYSIRGGLRTAPVAQMRITCRKLKVFLPEDTKKQFVQVYGKMFICSARIIPYCAGCR